MKHNFIYIGKDKVHFNVLVQDFRDKYTSLEIAPFLFSEAGDSKVQSLVLKIFNLKPKAVFIDFTRDFEEHLHLARLLSRSNMGFNYFLTGLIENMDQKDVFNKAILTGITTLFVKSKENDAIIYSCMCMAFPGMVQDHGFAKATLEDSASVYFPGRASIVTDTGLILESNFSLEKSSLVNLHSLWSHEKILSTPQARLISQKEENLFYTFLYSQTFDFEFAEKPILDSSFSKEAQEEKRELYNEKLLVSKQKMKKWVSDNQSDSTPKLMKSLVIDRSLHFYQNQERTDNYPFTIRCQPFLTDISSELKRNFADLIIFQFDDLPEEEVTEEGHEDKTKKKEQEETIEYKNDLLALKEIIKISKTIPHYNPFIVVFNTSEITSENIKAETGFEQIMINKSKIIPELILKMANILLEKLKNKNEKLLSGNIFLNKNNKNSFVTLEGEITILSISENDIYFKTDHKIIPNFPLILKSPVNLLITPIDFPKHIAPFDGYYGLIHGVGETQLMELRKFINSVFFREKELSKKQEREDFKKLNEKVFEEIKSKAEEEKIEEDKPLEDEKEDS